MARHIDFSKHSAPVLMAAHAIGLDHKRPYIRHGKTFYRPYRNYYTVREKSCEWEMWMDMVKYGFAVRYRTANGGSGFHLTRAGLDWLGETLGITIYDEED